MHIINRWVRTVIAAAFLFGGLAPVSAPALANAGEPPVQPLAPTGGSPGYINPPASCGADQGIYSTYPNVVIPNPGLVTSTVSVGLAGVYVWEVRVYTNITHTRSADLDIALVSPAGTRVTLTTDNGGTNKNVFAGTLWSDTAGYSSNPGPVTLKTFSDNDVANYLSPEEPLSAFMGENPVGVWTLEVQDDLGSEAGVLLNWELDVTALAAVPTALKSVAAHVYDLPIPDDGTPLLVPFAMPAPLGRSDRIELITQIEHPKANDLELVLLDPEDNNDVTLAYHEGGANGNVFNGARWSDRAGATNAPGAVTDNTFLTGTVESPLAPQEPLRAAARFYETDLWTLSLIDGLNNLQTGRLLGLTAEVTSYACGPDLHLEGYGVYYSRLGSAIVEDVQVFNQGLTTTAPVYLTVTLPISGSFLSTSAPGWACTSPNVGTMGGSVLCNRPGLSMNTGATLTLQLSSPAAPQALGTFHALASTVGNNGVADCECDEVFAVAVSANKNPWDVYDAKLDLDNDPIDSGSVDDGGQDAFDGFGYLRLAIFNAGGSLLFDTVGDPVVGFGLTYAPGHRWDTTAVVLVNSIQVSRSLYAPANTNWLRYTDTFTNVSGASRTVWVGWGGNLGSDGSTVTAGTSSGDGLVTPADTWAVTIEDDGGVAGDPPVAYVLRSATDTTYQGPGLSGATPITMSWPISGDDNLTHIYKLVLAPGTSASLAYFLYRGLAENTDGPEECDYYDDCVSPPPGSEVTLAQTVAAQLAAQPDFCDLTAAQIAMLANWPGVTRECRLFIPALFR